jgi:hypothetical protein
MPPQGYKLHRREDDAMSVYRDRFRAEQAAHFRRVLLMLLGLIAGVIAVGSGLAVLNFYLTGGLH